MKELILKTGIARSLNDQVTLGSIDKNNEIELILDDGNGDEYLYTYINSDHALQIINHLKEQFGI